MTLFSAVRIGLVSGKLSHIPSLMDKPALRSYIEDDFGLQEALCAMEFSVTSSATGLTDLGQTISSMLAAV